MEREEAIRIATGAGFGVDRAKLLEAAYTLVDSDPTPLSQRLLSLAASAQEAITAATARAEKAERALALLEKVNEQAEARSERCEARAEKAEALYAKAWEECNYARRNTEPWATGASERLSKLHRAHDAARREAGL